ncbi:GreA/GreB family elongation factor [Tahibacter amnicola]|uniref:GreA/GreB family elongation factor n=1 Tax=Tahibacter amnicola TaxID=2976241 RepID=A0ABY6BK46_9GAMM|nr:GreA/GreB family elongation factor [Tahibacter amnicola]UXI68966.1 GreA/GreB family elongation factor [Tahibacter amnicola]
MSRAFVKESEPDTLLPEIPISEHPNRMTPRGLARLTERLETVRSELGAHASATDTLPDAAAINALEREQRWLEARIASATVVDLSHQPRDRVAFGATVDVVDEDGHEATYRIVGEDESDAEHGVVSWVSPLAKAVIGARVGDEVTWRRPAGDRRLEVVAIRYEG